MPEINYASLVMSVLVTAIIVSPVIFYLRLGWAWKKADILSSLTDLGKQAYLKRFQKIDVEIGAAPLAFKKFYETWFQRSPFVVPILLLCVVVMFQAYLVSELALSIISNDPHKFKMTPIAASGFAGAYTFVASEFITRARRRDLSVSDVMRGVLRLTVAVALGYTFGGLVTERLAAFMSFAVGIFPLNNVSSILQKMVSKQINQEDNQQSVHDPIVMLPGVDKQTSERLADSDITTITQLAYCDPILLTMQTNLGFSFVVDLVSQALAWIYIEDSVNHLRRFGLRGAFEIRLFNQQLYSSNEGDRLESQRTLEVIAIKLSVSETQIKTAFNMIAYEPYTDFLEQVYT